MGGHVDAFHLRLEGCLDKSLQAVALAAKVDNPHSEAVARFFVAFSLITMGDTSRVDQALVDCLEAAERLRDRYWVAIAYWGSEILARLRGEWELARHFGDRGLAMASTDYHFLGQRAILEYQVGDFDQGEAYLERLLEYVRSPRPGPGLDQVWPAVAIPTACKLLSRQSSNRRWEGM